MSSAGTSDCNAGVAVKAADVELARLALSRGWITEERMERALLEADRCQALGLAKSVEEILVEDGSLTGEGVRSLRDALGLTLKHPRIGDFEIVRRVGIGGTGTVFEACHVRLKQRIALKILFPRLAKDPQSTERFLREARTLARLNHPHLVHAIDAGQDGEVYYLAMEYIEGENLLQILFRDGPFPPLRTLEVVRDVTEALGALEEKGLVHRDVKPANILIGPDGTVKLADFGLLARVEESGGPGAGPLCGTPHYISPEQLRHRTDLDFRSDLYALGATWFHILAGRPPFVGKSTRDILHGHLYQPPQPPSSVRKNLPAAIDRMVLRWLAKNREERPASSKEALEDLARAESALRARERFSISAIAARARKARPSRRTVMALAGLVLLLFATLTFSLGRPRRGEAPVVVVAAPPPRSVAVPVSPAEPPAITPVPESRSGGPRAPEPPPPTRSDKGSSLESTAAPVPRPALLRGPTLASKLLPLARSARARAVVLLEPLLASPPAPFRRLELLGRSFRASFVALEPGQDPPRGIVLFYDFERSRELDDFRSAAGAWAARDGKLLALASPGKSLDSVAWYTPPVRMDGESSSPAPWIVALGDVSVAPGSGEDAWVLKGAEERVDALSAPTVPARPWSVLFLPASVEVTVGGRTRTLDSPRVEAGRLILLTAPGASLEYLRIEGILQPDWAAERARLLLESDGPAPSPRR
ncbi:MAG TPA: serine/threonine-protein kinase [Planctomycetota bacterium]|nr:serine/threonine-protein kinase [Planctomycetota bacterium]